MSVFICMYALMRDHDGLCGLWGRGLALIGTLREVHTFTAVQRPGLKGLCGSWPASGANPHLP